MPADHSDLRRLALGIFAQTLEEMDARRAVHSAVHFEGARLKIFDAEFDAGARPLDVYSVALGKAAGSMAVALDEILGEHLREGVVSAPPLKTPLPARWQVFEGGHPLPNEASLQAARAALDLLSRADEQAATNARSVVVVFLVSGGGSAMLELPRDAGVALEDLRAMNRSLVTCGAGIAEINAVRRAVSAVKGGGLSRAAARAAQVTLVVSDVGRGAAQAVASGPTFSVDDEQNTREARDVIQRYDLAAHLPASILRAVERHRAPDASANTRKKESAVRRHFVLLDNALAVKRAAEIARGLGFAVEVARDLVEQNVEEGARALVSRLFELRERTGVGRGVCVISGGEFACPVRGDGVGGRNSETVLRCALELDARTSKLDAAAATQHGAVSPESFDRRARFVVLGAGTDGIDGNSPAAGALCDETTAARARSLGLDAGKFLDASDAYTFFAALNDALVTGATGTNVRDLRILLGKE
ncbi:MAG: glycerate 2-kinase [Acidobacteriota bacterium]|nr:glycerate 2-kinase [Acidobacteriota bacterium]